MADETTPDLTQALFANPPQDAQGLRDMLDQFAPLLNADLPEVGAFHEAVPMFEGVTTDVVVPQGDGPYPVLVYLHGGGWVAGSPKTHQKLGYRFAEAGYLVFNVDYRMAPEHPFPTPFEDCVQAIRWAGDNAKRYGGDASKLAVGGDSAGGNLTAASVAALADDASAPDVSAVLLIYGVFDFAKMTIESAVPAGMEAMAEKMMEVMVGSYLGSERSDALLADPRVSPVHVAHKLPPAHVVCGTLDDLVTQAADMAAKLGAAGVEHEHVDVENMPHGYVQMEFLPQARESIDRMIAFLRKHV